MAQLSVANPEEFIELFITDSNAIEMPKYSSNHAVVSVAQPEIVTSMQQLHLPTEVVSKSIEIFYRVHGLRNSKTKAVKGSRKVRLIFYCIFMAYNELSNPVDPSYAADLVNLPRNEIDQAFNEYSPTGPTIIAPESMVRFYINRINSLNRNGNYYDVQVINEEVRKIIQICRSTKAGQEWVENTSAKIVAIVALYFYLNDRKNLEIGQNIRLFEQACYLSWACIRRYHDQIIKYYNSYQ